MNNTYRHLFWVILLLCSVATQAETLEAEIGQRLSALNEAQTPEQVDGIIAETQEYLKANRNATNDVAWGFLQADIVQTHGRICTDFWLADKTNENIRRRAGQLLQHSIDLYEEMADQADDSADDLAARLRSSAQRSDRWRQFAGYPSRANYSRGWSYYSLGLLDDAGAENFEQAMEYFEPFMRAGYRDNRIVQDCFLGYGLCLYGMGHFDEAADLLNESRVTPENTSSDAFRSITLLRMRIYEAMNNTIATELAAGLYFQHRGENSGDFDGPDREIALKRIAALARLSRSSDDNPYASVYRQRLNLFCRQLPAGQWNTQMTQLLQQAGVETGLGYLQKAKDAYDSGDTETALQQTQAGLEFVDSQLEPETAVDLVYMECLCLNKLSRHEEVLKACKLFLKEYPDDSRLGVISKMAMESAIEWAKSGGPVDQAEFDAFASAFSESQPDQATESLLWYAAGFAAAQGLYAEAEELLKGSDPEGPEYLRCVYLRCFAAYQQGRGDNADPQALSRAIEAVVEFANASKVAPPKDWVCAGVFDLAAAIMDECVQRQVQLAEPMAVIRAAQSLPCVDADRQQQLLAAKIRFFGRYDELQQLREILKQLKQQKANPAIHQSLLVTAELLMTEPTDSESSQQRSSLAAELFRYLLAATPKDDDAMYRQILWQLAESLRAAGRFEQAAGRYEEILKADGPRKQIRVLRGLAVSTQAMGDYVRAVEQWRYLARTLNKQQPGWYEANYELIICHYHAGDTGKATQLLEYFYLKHAESMPTDWADRFGQLQGGVWQ